MSTPFSARVRPKLLELQQRTTETVPCHAQDRELALSTALSVSSLELQLNFTEDSTVVGFIPT